MIEASPAPRATAAAQARVLRKLYLMLMFRGRRRAAGRGSVFRPTVSFAFTLVVFTLLGMLAIAFARLHFTGFSAALHAMTFVMVGLNLAATSGTVLFTPDEAEVLLHRPIEPRALLAAKVRVMVMVSLAMAFALNLYGFVIGALRPEAGWRFVPAHLFSLTLEVIFCTSFVVLAYNLCLRWFGRNRLDNVLTTTQVLVAIAAIGGGQFVPRLLSRLDSTDLTTAPWWITLLPPAWFAGLDTVLVGGNVSSRLLFLAALGTGATGLTTWLGVRRLATSYEQGLVSLNEAGPAAVRPGGVRGRWAATLLRLPLVRGWIRDPVERAAFRLTLAGLARSRGVKLRVFPMLAQFLVYPLMILFGGAGNAPFSLEPFAVAFGGSFIAMLPPLVLDQLRPADDWRAADVFRQAPIARPAAIFHGSRKAVILGLCAPGVVLIVLLGLVWLPRRTELLLLLPGLLALPLFGLVPAFGRVFLPFAEPAETQMHNASGCLFLFLMTTVSMVIAVLASWAWMSGWYEWMVVGETAFVLVATHFLYRMIDRQVLRPER